MHAFLFFLLFSFFFCRYNVTSDRRDNNYTSLLFVAIVNLHEASLPIFWTQVLTAARLDFAKLWRVNAQVCFHVNTFIKDIFATGHNSQRRVARFFPPDKK